jgi:hypothetical protein
MKGPIYAYLLHLPMTRNNQRKGWEKRGQGEPTRVGLPSISVSENAAGDTKLKWTTEAAPVTVSDAGNAALGLQSQRATSCHGKPTGSQRKKQQSHCFEEVEASPNITHPQMVSYPQHAKKWQLGVEKCLGQKKYLDSFR